MRMRRERASDRQTWIDALKGVAMCGVVMIHSGGDKLPSVLGKIGAAGKYGVQIFFLISAYLAFVSYDSLRKDGATTRKDIVKWVAKRFVRLIPLYYLAVVGWLLYVGGHSYWLGTVGEVTGWNILSHLLFLHGLSPYHANSIVGVEWYLGVLAIFYILVPLLHRLINSLEKAVMAFTVGIFLCWAMGVMGTHVTANGPDAYIYSAFFGTFWIVGQLPVLLLGIFFFFIDKAKLTERIRNRCGFSYILMFVSLCLIGGLVLEYNYILGVSGYTFWGIAFFLLLISQKMHTCPILDNPVFRFIGKNSFPIYLFHHLWISVYDEIVPQIWEGIILNWLVKYFIVVVISAALGWGMNKFLGAPITKRLSCLTDRL